MRYKCECMYILYTLWTYVQNYVRMYTYICAYVCVNTYIYSYLCTYVHNIILYECVYCIVCIYLLMYVCTYVRTYVYQSMCKVLILPAGPSCFDFQFLWWHNVIVL